MPQGSQRFPCCACWACSCSSPALSGAATLAANLAAATIACSVQFNVSASQRKEPSLLSRQQPPLQVVVGAAYARALGAGKRSNLRPWTFSSDYTNSMARKKFRRFRHLPEPLRAAIFVAAWSDRNAWLDLPSRQGLRLVCRQACAVVDGLVTKLSVHYDKWSADENDRDIAVLHACIHAVGSGRFPALRDWRVECLHPTPEDAEGTRAAVAQAIPPNLQKLSLKGDRFGRPAVVLLASAASARLAALRELDLRSAGLGDASVEALVQVAWPALEVLILKNNAIAPEGAAALAEAVGEARLPALRHLDLDFNAIDNDGVEALMQAQWPRLEELHLAFASIWEEGAATLGTAGVVQLPALQHLDLSWNHLGAGVEALVGHPWPRLQVLHLRDTWVKVNGAAALASAATHLPAVRNLNLASNSLNIAGVQALMQAPWRALEVLDLTANFSAANHGAEHLASALSAQLPALWRLCLGHNHIGDAGVEALASHLGPRLQALDLSGTSIGARAAAGLAAKAHHFPGLKSLSLLENESFGAAGIRALLRAPWTSLQRLDLARTGLGLQGIQALAAASRSQLPALRVLTLGVEELSSAAVNALAVGGWRHLELLVYYANDELKWNWEWVPDAVVALAVAGAARFPSLRALAFGRHDLELVDVEMLEESWPNGIRVLSTSTCWETFHDELLVMGVQQRLEARTYFGLDPNDYPD